MRTFVRGVRRMAEVCPYICNNKTDYGYCQTSACINPTHRTPTFTSYDPIEIARQYAPKFDKPAVDMVAVVRCRDCKWYKEGKYSAPTRFCFRLKDEKGEEIGYNFASDDFCSYGERKDEVEE